MPVTLRIEKKMSLTKQLTSLLLVSLCLLNSFSAIISFTGLKTDIEFSWKMGTENEQQEERSDPEVKEVFSFYTVTVNHFALELNSTKQKRISINASLKEDVNLSNPAPPPKQA